MEGTQRDLLQGRRWWSRDESLSDTLLHKSRWPSSSTVLPVRGLFIFRGPMSDDLIRLRQSKSEGRAGTELIDSELSVHAKICYVVMTLFGSEGKKASRNGIQRRMSVGSKNTVRKAQDELIESGWIKKTAEGSGDKPTEWEVFDVPFGGQLELIPDGSLDDPLLSGDDRGVTRPPVSLGSKGSKGSMVSTTNTPTTDKSIWKSSDGKTWTEFIEAALAAINGIRKGRGLSEMTFTEIIYGRNGNSAKKLIRSRGVTFEKWARNLANLGRHPFAGKKAWALWWFCDNFEEFENGAESLGAKVSEGTGKTMFRPSGQGNTGSGNRSGGGAVLQPATNFGKSAQRVNGADSGKS